MTPHAVDLLAAVPRCPWVVDHKTGRRCDMPMVYSVAGNVWKCPRDGTSIKGLMVAEFFEAA